jgi:hypothetical protein
VGDSPLPSGIYYRRDAAKIGGAITFLTASQESNIANMILRLANHFEFNQTK